MAKIIKQNGRYLGFVTRDRGMWLAARDGAPVCPSTARMDGTDGMYVSWFRDRDLAIQFVEKEG
jgi:hypothetical protein